MTEHSPFKCWHCGARAVYVLGIGTKKSKDGLKFHSTTATCGRHVNMRLNQFFNDERYAVVKIGKILSD